MLAAGTLAAVRVLRTIALTKTAFLAGFVAAAVALRQALRSRGDAESDEVALVAIFNGVELKSRAEAFRGGSMLAWFGGIAVDLREATLVPEARVSLTSLLGGIALRVPPGWRVVSEVATLGGGVEIDVPEPSDPDAPRLVLHGFALLGGIAVTATAPDAAES
jgi:hypothetical protein